ncbi:ROK family transcriptional regulator [Microbacterium sp. lyk4-40-TSB-66]|uniref:ROK family transcriptional regulator n=1 Tax=Microbacterium sp. lyk4-40-TSB-66 TaxID=3040294 RepID=UPI00254A872C|nr:ROK family transcriptional regulator [Microbacterium sp. lyk4-40-TSB-66]
MLTESEAAVARAVVIHGPLSRRALAARLHLSPPSLTRLTRPLVDAGILIERDDETDGSVGRPSRPLDVSPSAGTFVGVKLTSDHLHLVATDIRAEVRDRTDRSLASTEPRAVIDDVARAVTALGRDDLRGVGVSLGGHVWAGVAVDAPFLGWQEVPLADALAARLGIPITLENDVVALAEAERWFGVGRDLPGFAIVTVGAGVGFGLVIDGRTVRTPDAGVGTVGHLPLRADGPTCPLGHRGCAAALLTTSAISAQVSAALARDVTYDEVMNLARDRDPAATAVMDAAGDALGTLFALAANLSLQSDIVLAGEGVEAFDLVRERVDAALSRGRAGSASAVAIHPDRSGFSAWARGAAAVAIQAAMGRISLND